MRASVEGQRGVKAADKLGSSGSALPHDVCPSRTPLAHPVRAYPLATHTVTALAPDKGRPESAIAFAAAWHASLVWNSTDPTDAPDPEPANMMMST
jgi:hypothetical protein